MSATLAMLTIGVVPVSEVLPLLTEHISPQQIAHISLLGALSREEVAADYAASPGEESIMVLLADNGIAEVSYSKVELALKSVIEVLDNQGYDVILLMSTVGFKKLTARNAILLEPDRIIPPLISSIVNEHQVGIVLPFSELMASQEAKWRVLEKPPVYTLASPIFEHCESWIAAGKALVAQGAEVILLDCLGFHQRHRDLLQKALGIPVLLTNVLVARLAAELLI